MGDRYQTGKKLHQEEIIAMYFNIFDWLYQADGLRSASRIYYGKEPNELNAEEGAMLVGMFKSNCHLQSTPQRKREAVIGQKKHRSEPNGKVWLPHRKGQRFTKSTTQRHQLPQRITQRGRGYLC